MKLSEMIKNLQALEAQGHGTKEVFCRHGASGSCYEVGSAHVTDRVEDTGPFDLDEGAEYISIYVGN